MKPASVPTRAGPSFELVGMTDGFARTTFVTPEGLRLVGDVGGPPDAPAVILLHGGGQTRHSWAHTMRRLVDRGYHVVTYDARGHGDSDWSPPGDYSVPALAADLLALRASLPGRAAFVGASMGGTTGFYAVGSGTPPAAEALVMVDIALRVAESGGERIHRFMRSHPNGFATLEEAVDAVVAYNPERPRPRDPSGLRKNLREREDGRLYWHWDPRLLDVTPSSEPPARSEALLRVADRVLIPTLLVRGGHSDIVDDEGVAEMLRLVPQTEVYDVPEAGHMVAGDRNDAFGAGVLAFLGRNFPI
jgi:pimeloyl-ACP methyl ester carboxylesterase